MYRCLCCNKEISNPNEYEKEVRWHSKCIKKFFGTSKIPEIDCSEQELEKLANNTVSKGLTVPGVQKKLSLHLETIDKNSKLTIVDYPTGYILKPKSNDFAFLPEAEFLSMKMAEKASIKTVPNALILFNGEYSYITKRIDRSENEMFAMEDFCQLVGRITADKYKSSYEACGKIIRLYSKNIGIDIAEFYYRLLFCFVTGNSDMHLKNFSLIENNPGNRVFGLAPAYDMLPVNIIMPADKEQMALTVNGKKRNIRRKDFIALADNVGIKQIVAEGLMKKIIKCKETFINEVRESYISEKMKDELINLIGKRLKVFETKSKPS